MAKYKSRKKTTPAYWKDRKAQETIVWETISDGIRRENDAVRRQDAIYGAALKELQDELDALEKQVGTQEITRAMMQKPLTPQELKAWSERQKQRLDDLIAEFGEKEGRKIYGLENVRTGREDRTRRTVQRIQALKQSIETITSGTAARQEAIVKNVLEDEAEEGAKAFKKQFPTELQASLDAVSKDEVDQVTKAVWHGGNYSQKVWKDQKEMAKDLERTIQLGVTNGLSVKRMAKEMERHVKSGKKAAERLIRTEMNRVSNATELQSYKDNGIKYYSFMATEDARTCEICGKLHDQIFEVAEAKVGVNYPPMHPNCRCRTVISTVDKEGKNDTSWLDDMQKEIDDLWNEIEEDDRKDAEENSR